MGYLCEPNIITWTFMREAEESEWEKDMWRQKQRLEWCGVMNQGKQAASGSWKRQEMNSSLEKEDSSTDIFILAKRCISDFCSLEV